MSSHSFPKRDKFQRIVSEIGWTMSSSIMLVLTGFFLNVILGNLLGLDGLGVYTVAVTIYMLTTTLTVIGLPIVLLKFTAEYKNQSDISSQFYTASLIIVLATTILTSLLLFLLRYPIAAIFNMSELVELLAILAVGIPFYGLNKIAMARLNGLRYMGRLASIEIFRYLLMLGLTIAGVVWLQKGLYGAAWALTIAEVLLFPFLFGLTRIYQDFNLTNFRLRCAILVGVGKQVTLSRIIEDLDARLSVLLVGLFLTKSEVGIYSFAVLMADGLLVLPATLNKVTGPVITQLHSQGKSSSLEELINQTMQIAAFLLMLCGGLVVAFYSPIVNLLFPNEPGFLIAEMAFIILAFGSVFQGITISVGLVFVGVNRPDVLIKINIQRLIINFVTALLLVNLFRIEGAALSKTLTAFVIFIVRTQTMARVANLHVEFKPLFLIPLFGAIIVLSTQIIQISSIYTYLSSIFLWSLFALVVIRLLHFERYLIHLKQMFIAITRIKVESNL